MTTTSDHLPAGWTFAPCDGVNVWRRIRDGVTVLQYSFVAFAWGTSRGPKHGGVAGNEFAAMQAADDTPTVRCPHCEEWAWGTEPSAIEHAPECGR